MISAHIKHWGLRKPPPGYRINTNHPVGSAIVGCWLCNEGSGTIVEDIGPFQNIGTITPNNGGWLTDSMASGSSFNYDVINSYTTIPDLATQDPLEQTTVLVWAKTSNVGQNFSMFATRGGDGGAGSAGWNLRFNGTTGKPHFSCYINGGWIDQGTYTTSIVMPTSQWTQIVGVYNGAQLQTFVNGVLSGGWAIGGPLSRRANSVFIGRRNDGLYFGGQIDHLLILNRGLKADEVRDLYLNPFAFMQPHGWRGLNTTAAPSFNPGWAYGATSGVLGSGVF